MEEAPSRGSASQHCYLLANTQGKWDATKIVSCPIVSSVFSTHGKITVLSVDVCGPYDAYFYADAWLTRTGRTSETGYQRVVIAATAGPIRTKCGIEIAPTHSFNDVGDPRNDLYCIPHFCSHEPQTAASLAPRNGRR